ncbi:hypothetical protein ACFFTM_02500 [Pseudoduganella plicata]|uniref:DUF2283 domain-containing protein n=1 Tax=Pseudoduganella plicata TaxID=321984 RepID=A0ABX5S952_9BURK|nr:DUF2283 domain-containing protein [Pseudoduganella plicata]QBQ36869.1 DUF2283 domain-containing protein [Pseudoduganella plicata]
MAKMMLKISEDDEDVAYLTLPNHSGQRTAGAVQKQAKLHDLIKYNGPDIHFGL